MADNSADTFINQWWNRLGSPLDLDTEKWMEDNSLPPADRFWTEEVFARQSNELPPSKSLYGASYDFYHDCILRHLRSNPTALTIVKESNQNEDWTYANLHHCVNFHIEKWSYSSPLPQQVIVIIGSPNIRFVIALLTALRFGLKIYYFPTNSPFLGKNQITKFLSEIKPHFATTTDDQPFPLDDIPQLTINEKGLDEENHAPHSFAYPANTDNFIALSLYNQETLSFVPLYAQTLYLHALRDALFSFNLLHHTHWSAPMSCPIRTEPWATLMTLIAGATRVWVSDEAITNHPQLLEDQRIHLLLIAKDLCDLWMRAQTVPTRYLKSCCKNPIEITPQTWKTFAQLNKLEKTPFFDVIIDHGTCGVSLFSKPSLDPFAFYLKPALGMAWSLENAHGAESLNGFGIFNSCIFPYAKNDNAGNLTAMHVERNLMLTGTVTPSREGISFPIFEVETSIKSLAFVEACVVHPIQKTGHMFSRHFVLIVFVDPSKPSFSEYEENCWTQEINQKISTDLGSGFLPDTIEYFPLLPKTNILGVDRNWCGHQYDSGLLLQKKMLPYYHLIGTLKKLAQEIVEQL